MAGPLLKKQYTQPRLDQVWVTRLWSDLCQGGRRLRDSSSLSRLCDFSSPEKISFLFIFTFDLGWHHSAEPQDILPLTVQNKQVLHSKSHKPWKKQHSFVGLIQDTYYKDCSPHSLYFEKFLLDWWQTYWSEPRRREYCNIKFTLQQQQT